MKGECSGGIRPSRSSCGSVKWIRYLYMGLRCNGYTTLKEGVIYDKIKSSDLCHVAESEVGFRSILGAVKEAAGVNTMQGTRDGYYCRAVMGRKMVQRECDFHSGKASLLALVNKAVIFLFCFLEAWSKSIYPIRIDMTNCCENSSQRWRLYLQPSDGTKRAK